LIDVCFTEETGRVIRGEALISRNWNRAKQLQIKADSAAKMIEGKKKIIWNFLPQNKNKDSCDQVNPQPDSMF